MSAIVRKLSDQTWPGFDDFKKYFLSCAAEFPKWAPDIKDTGDRITFAGTGDDMVKVLNSPEFRTFWNLLPAGMDAATAFCQLYALKYPSYMGLEGKTGTYTLRMNVWTDLWEQQNEAQFTQSHRLTFLVRGDRENTEITICL
ncbi:hypothetical protein [Streptomyces sp. YS-3]|uniref:hypothetical protein n=1 Tax=Streptomyces sp. YS-3 TaxID=3381352 RepID=UPI0038623F45